MTPVKFAGSVPTHLQSAEAVRMEKEQFDAEVAKRLADNLASQLKLLNGNLASQETGDIVTALSDVLASASPGIPTEEVTRMALRALRHLADNCDQPITCHPSRHWNFWSYGTTNALAKLRVEGRPPVRSALIDLQLQVLKDGMSERRGSEVKADLFHRSLERVAVELRKTADPCADDFDLRLITSARGHLPARVAPWLADKGTEAPLVNSKAFMHKAWPLMNVEQRSRYADSCELNWLPEKVAIDSMCRVPNAERCSRFTEATPQLLGRALREFMSPVGSAIVANHVEFSFGAAKVPCWKTLATDTSALREAFGSDWLVRGQDGISRAADRQLGTCLYLMNQGMPDEVRYVLLSDIWRTASTTITRSRNRVVAIEQVQEFLPLLGRITLVKGAEDIIRKHFLGMDLLSNPLLCPDGKPLLLGGAGEEADQAVARQLRFHDTNPATYNPIRAIVIDAGLISIGSVRASDQRKDIIGPALARNPGRLAEVEDLERFVELARRFNIPIELPTGVNEALVKQASMRNAMVQAADPLAQAADPLAHAAEEKRPKRRARP